MFDKFYDKQCSTIQSLINTGKFPYDLAGRCANNSLSNNCNFTIDVILQHNKNALQKLVNQIERDAFGRNSYVALGFCESEQLLR